MARYSLIVLKVPLHPKKTNKQAYRRDEPLMNELLPATWIIADEVYIFQQDNASAHRARQTVQLFRCEAHEFIAPDILSPNSLDLNPVGYYVWGVMQQWTSHADIGRCRAVASEWVSRV